MSRDNRPWTDDVPPAGDDHYFPADDAPQQSVEPAPASTDLPPLFMLPEGEYAIYIGKAWVRCNRQYVMNWLTAHLGMSTQEAKGVFAGIACSAGFEFHPETTDPVVPSSAPGDNRMALNTFEGILTPWPEPVAEAEIAVYLDLIRNLTPDITSENSDGAILLDFLSIPLKSLHAKRGSWRTHLSPLLKGVQGAGKGWLAEVLQGIYKKHFLALTQESIEDDFSPLGLERALMVNIDEVESPKKLNKLKNWTTEERIPIRHMRMDPVDERVHFNLLYSSNLEKPLDIDSDNRRIQPIECHRKLPLDIQKRLIAEKAAGWPNLPKFHRWLIDRPGDIRRLTAVHTTARANLIEASENIQAQFITYIMTYGINQAVSEYEAEMWRGTAPDPAKFIHQHTTDPSKCDITTKAFRSLFLAFATTAGQRNASHTVVKQMLRRYGVVEGSARFANGSTSAILGLPRGPAKVATDNPPDIPFEKDWQLPN